MHTNREIQSTFEITQFMLVKMVNVVIYESKKNAFIVVRRQLSVGVLERNTYIGSKYILVLFNLYLVDHMRTGGADIR